jgi:ubiquinone/menaquinone biosynthesis C-methylase UbiE
MAYDGQKIPFEDKKFDVVLSNAVLEHVLDLEVFFRNLGRVTKNGGLSYHLYHNYYSFTGAHMPESWCQKNPWGHLRGIYDSDPLFLNQATIEQVSKQFNCVFRTKSVYQIAKDHSKYGVDKGFKYEGQEWLTDDIRSELAQFSDEQLLARSYLIVGTKK